MPKLTGNLLDFDYYLEPHNYNFAEEIKLTRRKKLLQKLASKLETFLLLYTPTVYTISDINWGEGIERKQIENILKEAVRQAFDYKLCERVANQTIDILVGNVVELEWE